MEKKISITIEEDVYEKFCLALNLTKDAEEKAVESCLRWYIAKTFGKISQEYEPEKEAKQERKSKGNFYAKAKKRIPVWAERPEQYCHKIIRGFFWCLEHNGQVTIEELETICSKEDFPQFYVPTFRNNYYQMKIDAAKTYGKVFEDNGVTINIWNEIKDTLLEYKKYFCD